MKHISWKQRGLYSIYTTTTIAAATKPTRCTVHANQRHKNSFLPSRTHPKAGNTPNPSFTAHFYLSSSNPVIPPLQTERLFLTESTPHPHLLHSLSELTPDFQPVNQDKQLVSTGRRAQRRWRRWWILRLLAAWWSIVGRRRADRCWCVLDKLL